MYKSCGNCNANVDLDIQRCPICMFDGFTSDSSIVRFGVQAKEASDGLGGLLDILPVNGQKTKFIAKCTGGVFAIGQKGNLLWRQDWLYITSIEIKGQYIIVNGKLLNVDSGELSKSDM
jgi:hypothetical protein